MKLVNWFRKWGVECYLEDGELYLFSTAPISEALEIFATAVSPELIRECEGVRNIDLLTEPELDKTLEELRAILLEYGVDLDERMNIATSFQPVKTKAGYH